MSDFDQSKMQPLPVAPRYLRRNAQRAMSGYVVRGLVELITNARDSGYRLYSKERLTAADLQARPIELAFDKTSDRQSFLVRDRFEGMSAATMKARLLQYGETASEFASGALVRGINARGAKDVAVLGRVHFESLYDDQLVSCDIVSGQYAGPSSRPATEEDRIRLEIAQGNGTVVQLFPSPDTTVPNFTQLARDLDRHIEMRYTPASYPHIPLAMQERKKNGSGRDRLIRGFEPNGDLLDETELALPDFAAYGDGAVLRLYRSTESLALGGNSITRLWRSEGGVLVDDGRTAHDIGFLGARRTDAAASHHLFGSLHLPQIPPLLIEFEQREKDRENDSTQSHNELNPIQVTDPDRQGLNPEHPFVAAVEEAVRPRIEAALNQLQEELTPAPQERISSELRKTLQNLGERLAERLEVSQGGQEQGRELPVGLSFVPAGLRVELGRSKRVGIYLRPESERGDTDQPSCNFSVESDAIALEATVLPLVPAPSKPEIFYGSLMITGVHLTEGAFVSATAGGRTALLKVSVRDPIEDGTVELDRDLQFSQRRYTSVPGRNKRLTVYADAALDGKVVEIAASDSRLSPNRASIELEYDAELGVAAAQLTVAADTVLTARVSVTCGSESDEATLVVRDLGSRARVEFEFLDHDNFGPGRRFRWHFEKENVLQIAAKHPTLARVLGPDVDPRTKEEWPGQQSPQARAILAELIVEAYVDRRLQSELPSMGVGIENLVDPVDYENFRYQCLEEVFSLVHEALTPEYS